MKFSLRPILKPKRLLAAAVAVVLAAVLGGWLGWYLLPPLDPAPYTRTVSSGQILDRHGERLLVSLSGDETWSLPRAYGELSPFLLQATQSAEDQRFWRHRGVDPVAVLRAVVQNVTEVGVASGASTLTMQVVKLGGHDSRSISGKVGQAIGALRLEKSLAKEEILSAYLSRAPYGMNLVGVEAASWRYFGKSAQTLNLPEAALLAGLPKAPSRLNPLEHPERAKLRRDYVLRRMHDDGFIDVEKRDWALATPVSAEWHDFPRLAPHLAVPLSAELDRGESIRLTLDATLQSRLERDLPHHLKQFNGTITNGALLVADVQTGNILARVGSANFENTPGGGHVDACRSPRSPGSTLKPFLYGWAMAQQQLYPSEVLLDDVADYGGYNPGNFDGSFNGVVTATEALRYSLNVPAVALLGRVGVPGFLGYLQGAGLGTITRDADDYGLGLAIGNCEVRLEELARLYLSLASLGEQNVLRWREGAAAANGGPVFSPAVCRMLYDMLAQPFPSEVAPGLTRTSGNLNPVCWKTGTSTGYHDAWTFAFNRHYLVAVWLGNNSGQESRQLIGARAALPLAENVFRSLPPKSTPAWPGADPSDVSIDVCTRSGLPAAEHCPETASVVLPASIWLHRRCTLHPASQAGITVAAAQPADATRWDLSALSAAKANLADLEARSLAIAVPAQSAEYVLSGVAGGDQLRLTSSLGETVALHWYMDDQYLGQSGPDSPVYWQLSLGEHRATCVSLDGATSTVRFSVVRPSGGVPIR
ncbi:MAG: penicillin-binding protein 1C [Candidatus Hydrogenedentes bacterium]|nr:penicillin-binding protein 1C [Candidatus Hydrogenedentota bacterium]